MAKKSNQVRWIIALAIVALLVVLVYSSFQQTSQRYEVCVAFKGATHCATAAGSTYSQAVRSAQEIDCEFLARGRDENMVCLDASPTRIRSVK
jgi:Tfp pilus assembly protein FimT